MILYIFWGEGKRGSGYKKQQTAYKSATFAVEINHEKLIKLQPLQFGLLSL